MAEGEAKVYDEPRKNVVAEFEGVELYGRGPEDRKTEALDAVAEDEEIILRMADQLQRLGYGVMRHELKSVGRTSHVLQAEWAGIGSPPEALFASGA